MIFLNPVCEYIVYILVYQQLTVYTSSMSFDPEAFAIHIAKFPLISIPISAIEEYLDDEGFGHYFCKVHGDRYYLDRDWVILNHPSNPALWDFLFVGLECPIIPHPKSKTGFIWKYPKVGRKPNLAWDQCLHPWDELKGLSNILNQIKSKTAVPKTITYCDLTFTLPVGLPHKDIELMKCNIRPVSKDQSLCEHKTYVPKSWLHDKAHNCPSCCGNEPVCARVQCTGCSKPYLRSTSSISTQCLNCHTGRQMSRSSAQPRGKWNK